MEPSTWCTRRLGGSVATSATIALTLARPRATTSSSSSSRPLSSDAPLDRPSTAPRIDSPSSWQHHDHVGPSLCDLCERLRGPSDPRRTVEEGPDRMTRRGGQQRSSRASSATISTDPTCGQRSKPDPSSASYVSSVVRWSCSKGRSRQALTCCWTILFLLVLAFSASADLQKPTSRERFSKEEGGESIHYM